MGNEETKLEQGTSHVLYGEPMNLTISKGQKFHSVYFAIHDEQEVNSFKSKLNETQKFTKNHLLLGNSFTIFDESVCTSSKILGCTFPFYPFSVEQEIENRKRQQRHLQKQELLNLVYQIAEGAGNFDMINEKVGDIRPSQILLDENKSNIKIVNYFTSPNQLTGYQKFYQFKQKSFLAPQQLKSLQKNSSLSINNHKADSFSLGLTILSIGNLRQLCDELYDFKSYSFSWTQLSSQLQNFSRRYGHFLSQIVKGLVQDQPRNRFYIGQIASILRVYQKQIYEMRNFEPDLILLQKSYQLNHSGPKSQNFIAWLQKFEQSNNSSRIVQKQSQKAVQNIETPYHMTSSLKVQQIPITKTLQPVRRIQTIQAPLQSFIRRSSPFKTMQTPIQTIITRNSPIKAMQVPIQRLIKTNSPAKTMQVPAQTVIRRNSPVKTVQTLMPVQTVQPLQTIQTIQTPIITTQPIYTVRPMSSIQTFPTVQRIVPIQNVQNIQNFQSIHKVQNIQPMQTQKRVVIMNPSIVKNTASLVNSRVRFQYASPTIVKRIYQSDIFQKINSD